MGIYKSKGVCVLGNELHCSNTWCENNFLCVCHYSLFYEPEDFYVDCTKIFTHPNGGVAVARGWTVKRIDPFERKAILEDDYEISYEKCLIATGKNVHCLGFVRVGITFPSLRLNSYVCITHLVSKTSMACA